MILVKRSPEDSTQKVLNVFSKRVKKSNLVARKRKTQFMASKLSPLRKKRKAIQALDYEKRKSQEEKLTKA